MYSFSYLEPVCCSMSSSNCCFLTCIQISQEASQVVWYSHISQNFPQFIVIHTVTYCKHVISVYNCFSSVTPSCLTLYNLMDCSTPGFPVSHYLPEFAQNMLSIGLVMVPNHLILCCPLLLFPSSIFPESVSFLMSRLFASGGQRIKASPSASVLPMNIQSLYPFQLTNLISLQFKGLSKVFSSTTISKYKFFGAQPSLWSNSHIHM